MQLDCNSNNTMATIGELRNAYEETRKPVKAVVAALTDLRVALEARKKSYDVRMGILLRAKPSHSRDTCLKDIEELRKKYDNFGDPSKHFQQLWDDNQQLYHDFESLVDEMWAEQKELPPSKFVENKEAANTEYELRWAKSEFTDAQRVYPHYQQQVLDNSKLLQQQVRVLVQNMNDKEELLKEFTESLNEPLFQTVKVVERPNVDIDASPTLPPEIMALIFSYLSLESVLALRQVNRAWYACFKYNEHVHEEGAKNRQLGPNPVSALVLAARLSTWTETVGVMAYLERSKNPVYVPRPSALMQIVKEDGSKVFTPRPSTWTKQEMEFDQDRNPEYAPCQTIVAIATKQVPADYQGLVSDDPECILNDSWYAPQELYALNPSTMVFKKSPWWDGGYYDFGIRRLSDGSYRVTHQGWNVVLPEFMEHCDTMTSNKDTFVGVDDSSHRAYVVTREFPDYRDGLGFEVDYMSACELRGTQETLLYVTYPSNDEFRVLDTANKRLVSLCVAPFCFGWRVVAQYDGAIWITQKYSRVIVPFFIDLETEKGYYQMDRAINVVARGEDWTRWKQCNVTRFLYRQKEKGTAEFLDLETRTVTRVEVEGENKLFVGFSGGKLGAWSMSTETLNKYDKELARLIGDAEVEDEQEEYDVSGVGEAE